MIKNLLSFRFSKNISHRFLKNSVKNITPIDISKRTFVINGKDLYYPKYGTSWYEPGGYSSNLNHLENEIYNKPDHEIKKQYNLQPQITNTASIIKSPEEFKGRIEYDDEYNLEKWNNRED